MRLPGAGLRAYLRLRGGAQLRLCGLQLWLPEKVPDEPAGPSKGQNGLTILSVQLHPVMWLPGADVWLPVSGM